MTHELPSLPYDLDALEPYLSKETLDFHYNKHHATYVKNLNNLVKDSPFEEMNLTEIIQKAEPGGVFNNAAQVWNHTFYWNCLNPGGGGQPKGDLVKAINSAFGSFDNFKHEFTQKAMTLFGSRWAWLVKNQDGTIAIVQSSNAGTPMTEGKKAILTCDVWEHAYYIDYRNARPKYVEAFWNIVNWGFAEKNFLG